MKGKSNRFRNDKASCLGVDVFNYNLIRLVVLVLYSALKINCFTLNKSLLRASTADVVKKMLFYHTKHLFYYFITSFYNIAFIRCFILQFYILK